MRVVSAFRHAIQSAEQQGRRVRALGANASLSDHAGDDCVVSTRGFHRVLPLWQGIRPQADATGLVRVECGMPVKRLCAHLHRQGRMLENTAAYTAQTVVGAMATASHGTGVGLPPMCDHVVSMVLVTRGGEALRIEPANGPTDASLYHEPACTLLQDDALFYAALTGLGAFGLVATVTLRTRLHVPLWEHRVQRRLEHALSDSLARPDSVRHASMLFNPHPHRGERTAVVTLRDVADPLRMTDALTPRQRWVPVLFSRLPLDAMLRRTLRHTPQLAPAVIARALRATVRRPIRLAAPRILDNHPLNRCAPARAVELFVPMSQWRAAVDDLLAVADTQAKHGRHLTAPISVRFVGASRHALAPTLGQSGAMIELVHLRGTADEERALLPYIDALMPYSGRMHLGLETPRLNLSRDYAELNPWHATRERFAPGPAFALPTFLEAA